MNMGFHIIPGARRSDEKLRRYVRSEYRERDASWFASSAANGRCLTLPGELAATICFDRAELEAAAKAPTARCCPVMNALSESGLAKGLTSRGEVAGEH